MQLDNSKSNLKGIKWYNNTVQGNIMKGKQHILKVSNILYEWSFIRICMAVDCTIPEISTRLKITVHVQRTWPASLDRI